MNIETTSLVKVLCDITRAGEPNPPCAAIVTALYPDSSGNTNTAVGAVLVDVTAFPNGHPPICVQQLRVYDKRSQGGLVDADAHGFAFITDDVTGAVAVGRKQSPTHPGVPA